MSFLEVFEVKMEVNDLRSCRDLNFRVELTKLDLCAKFQLPSFNRDFRAPDLNFSCKSSLNATPPLVKSGSDFFKRTNSSQVTIEIVKINQNGANFGWSDYSI